MPPLFIFGPQLLSKEIEYKVLLLDTWLTYVILALSFLVTPGISHLLMLSNTVAYGFRDSLATAFGDLTANTLQMLAAGLGLSALITNAPQVFTVIKWLGVGYLVFLGIKMLFRQQKSSVTKAVSRKQLFQQGFFTSASNPKAIVFFAALFPQFISAEAILAPQLAILTITYLFLDGCFLLLYGFCAKFITKHFQNREQKWLNIISGLFIMIAAILLAWKNIES